MLYGQIVDRDPDTAGTSVGHLCQQPERVEELKKAGGSSSELPLPQLTAPIAEGVSDGGEVLAPVNAGVANPIAAKRRKIKQELPDTLEDFCPSLTEGEIGDEGTVSANAYGGKYSTLAFIKAVFGAALPKRILTRPPSHFSPRRIPKPRPRQGLSRRRSRTPAPPPCGIG